MTLSGRRLSRSFFARPTLTVARDLLGRILVFDGKAARLVCEFTGMERATFCNTGSEAVMAAMRVATANWLARGGRGDLPATVAAALDLLDGGLQAAAAPPPARRRPRAVPAGAARAG